MKKFWSLLLALSLAAGFAVPAAAAPTDPPAATQVTEEPTEPIPEGTAPMVEYGTASVGAGCRTIDAQMPLGGSARFLETCQAAFVFEENTGTVVYAYNPDGELSPGSLAKVLTAIVAIEQGSLKDKVTVSSLHYNTLPAGALNANLKHDEVLTLEDLLYCMMLESANDAAISIAEHIAGSEKSFVDLMNQKAQELGCANSVFVNAHGLDATGQHTTARDMAKIVRYAAKNETFAEMFKARRYTVPATNRSEERKVVSDNYLIERFMMPKFNDERVTGGKSSATASSGASVVCTAEDKNMKLVCVVMGAERVYKENGYTVKYYGNFEEILELMDFVFDGFKFCQLYYEGEAMEEFPVANGANNVVGAPNNSRNAILPAKALTKNLILRYETTGGGLSAPIKKADQIATVQFWYQNSCVAETELYAMSDVRHIQNSGLDIQSAATQDDSNLKNVAYFVGMVSLIFVVPLGLYAAFIMIRRSVLAKRRRKRRSSRRRSR